MKIKSHSPSINIWSMASLSGFYFHKAAIYNIDIIMQLP